MPDRGGYDMIKTKLCDTCRYKDATTYACFASHIQRIVGKSCSDYMGVENGKNNKRRAPKKEN